MVFACVRVLDCMSGSVLGDVRVLVHGTVQRLAVGHVGASESVSMGNVSTSPLYGP